MQRKNINLYKNFKKVEVIDEHVLSWQRYKFINVVLVLTLTALIVIDTLNIRMTQNEQATAMTELAQLKTSYYEVKKSYPEIFFGADVNTSITQLQKNIEIEKKLLENMSAEKQFSAILIAIARTISPNVWLTQIIISKSGQSIQLKGKTLSMESLDPFLKQLLNDPIFTKYQANLSRVETGGKDEGSKIINFEIMMNER